MILSYKIQCNYHEDRIIFFIFSLSFKNKLQSLERPIKCNMIWWGCVECSLLYGSRKKVLSVFWTLLNLWTREFCADSKIRFLTHVAHKFGLTFVDKLPKVTNNIIIITEMWCSPLLKVDFDLLIKQKIIQT